MKPIDPKNLPTDSYIDGSHGTSGKSAWYLRLYYKVTSQSVSNNTSTVQLQLYIYDATGLSYNEAANSCYYTIQSGSRVYQPYYYESVGWYRLGSRSVTITHNADGTKTTDISGYWNSDNETTYTPASLSVSGSITLPRIARASVPTINTTSSGSTIVSTSPVLTKVYIQSHTASSTFKHTVKYAIAGLTNQTAGLDADATTGFTNWTSLTPPLSLLNKLTSYSGDKVTLTITLSTYTDSTLSTLVGSKNTTFTLTGIGYVSIDNGSSFDNYIAFVDNGSSWDRVVPYVDSGSAWNLY